MGITTISLALAIGQVHPVPSSRLPGLLLDRYGPRLVLQAALVTLAIGCAMTPFIDNGFGLAIAGIPGFDGFGRRRTPC